MTKPQLKTITNLSPPDPIIAEAVKETVQLMESKGLVVKKIKHLGAVT